jgi:hypothetical protein
VQIEEAPRDAIFIKCGRFQIGAFGRLAISSLLVVAIMIFAGRLLALW